MSDAEATQDILQTYALLLVGPPPSETAAIFHKQAFIASGLLREVEENLTSLLPAGYSAVIKEWDEI